jgi:hypothetical protein
MRSTVRKQWWIDKTSCARAIGGRTDALLSKNIDRAVKSLHASFKGRRGKKNDESDVHLPQPQKKKVVTYYILFPHRFF